MSDLFEFCCPVKILAGHKALSNLPYELAQLGTKRPLVVTDKGVVGAGLLDKINAAMEGAKSKIAHVYEDTPVDSSNHAVNEIAEIYRKKKGDCLIALGGGSAIDTAKGVAIVISEDSDDLMKFQGTDRVGKRSMPFIVIPTTAGTGSEVTAAAVIKDVDKGVKMPFMSDQLYPDLAINDPEMTITMPAKITAATGMDALTHAVEAYYSLQKNPVSDAFAVAAVRLIFNNLVQCVKKPKDAEARLNMLNASTLAGIAFSNAMVGIVHALAHATGGVAHVPHGIANGIFLPWGMEYNIDRAAASIGELAVYMGVKDVSGTDEDKARLAAQAVRNMAAELKGICGLPSKLSDAGVPENKLEQIAKAAINDGSVTYNPEEVEYNDALKVLKKAF